MTNAQKKIVKASDLDPSDFVLTSDGWSHNGFAAWQLETVAESKREGDSDDAKIAEVLRKLDDAE